MAVAGALPPGPARRGGCGIHEPAGGQGPAEGHKRTNAQAEGGMAPKPRLLLLHGNGTSAAILRVQLAPLLSRLEGEFDTAFVDGFHDCEPPADVRRFFPKGPFRNYCAKLDESGAETNSPTPPDSRADSWQYENLEEAAKMVETQVLDANAEAGPVVAVIGFSQGANLAAYLLARAAAGKGRFANVAAPSMGLPHSLGVGILMAPIHFGWVLAPEVAPVFENVPIDAAVSIVLGQNDPARARGEAMVELFDASRREVHTHSRGHQPLPSDRDERENLAEQLATFLRLHV